MRLAAEPVGERTIPRRSGTAHASVRLREAFGVWRSLVARFVRDEEAVGSNPATPTSQGAEQRSAP